MLMRIFGDEAITVDPDDIVADASAAVDACAAGAGMVACACAGGLIACA